MSDKRKEKNGISGKEKTKTITELVAENEELKEEVSEAQLALMELAELIVEGI